MLLRLIGLLLLAVCCAACVAPPRPLEGDLRSVAVDHSVWDGLLRQHVVDGVVDYPALCRESALGTYLSALASAPARDLAVERSRLALLLNGYNALVVGEVCKGRTPETLLGRYRFFLRRRVEFAGESITLWDLEHERIRPLGEPRIHFALVCASRSCPALRSEAFLAARLDAQLEDAARRFINDPVRNRIDQAAGEASLSKIFSWYEDDFLAVAPSIERYVATYVNDPASALMLRTAGACVESLRYDWSPNGPLPAAFR